MSSSISDLFGGGLLRTTGDDVAEFLNENPNYLNSIAAPDYGTPATDSPMIESPYKSLEKQEEDLRAHHKAEFPWLFDPNKGVRWDFDPIMLRSLAQENTWVGMLVQSISKEVAQTPWTIVEADEDTETAKRLSENPDTREPIEKQADGETGDEIRKLLHDPNPDDNWTDLAEMWMSDLLEIGSLCGSKAFPENAYDSDDNFTGNPESDTPLAIQASPPEVWTKDYQNKTGILSRYWQFEHNKSAGTAGGQRAHGLSEPIEFSPDEIVWDDMSPRSNRRYGMPPTLLVKEFLQLLDLTVDQEQQYFAKGSIPSGMIVFENWDREQVKEWKQENEENIKGKPHKMLMLAGQEGNVDYVPFSFNYDELQFLDRVRWYARVISSVFQVPTAVVGIEPEKINYNTFQGERENFESNTLGPYLQKIERVVNDQIVWKHWGRDYRFEFVPGVSESTRKLISDRVTREYQAGLVQRGEARRQLGYDETDGDDGFKHELEPNTSPEPEGPEGEDGATVDRRKFNEGVQNPFSLGHGTSGDGKSLLCEYSGKTFKSSEMIGESCPHCGLNPFDYGKSARSESESGVSKQESVGVDVFRIMAEGDHDYESDLLGMGADFPNHDVYVDWHLDAFGEDQLDNPHVSIYGSLDDLQKVTDGVIESIEIVESDVIAQSIKEKALSGDSGNSSRGETTSKDDEPLRSTDQWEEFTLQPSDIEDVAEELREDVSEVWDEVLTDEEIQRIIDRFASDGNEGGEETAKMDPMINGHDLDPETGEGVCSETGEKIEAETMGDLEKDCPHCGEPLSAFSDDVAEKSLTGLSREIKRIFEENETVQSLQEKVLELTNEKARDALEQAITETGDDVEFEQVLERLDNRDVSFARGFADRMENEIRETVADGWTEGKSSLDIADDIEEKAGEFEGWGAELIARQETHLATGEARSEFAAQNDYVEVWLHSGDYPEREGARETHDHMDGLWKRPSERWEVPYDNFDEGKTRKESVPGDSIDGLGCRCDVLLVDIEEVDPDDHRGVAT